MVGNSQSRHDALMDGLLGDFLDESTGLLQQLNNDLLRLDELIKAAAEPPAATQHLDLLNEMFRAAHSLKGLSGMMRVDNVNSLTHKVENIFDAARNGTLLLTTEVVDLVFQAIDRLEGMIALLSDSSRTEVEYADVLSGIEQLLLNAGALRPAVGPPVDIHALAAEVNQASNSVTDDTYAKASPDPVDDSLAKLTDDEDIPEKYIAIFIDESEQTLEELSELLLAGSSIEALGPLLTVCHRLKGSAASIGLHRVAHVAHRMEDLLQDLRSRQHAVEGQLTDALLANVDALRTFVAGLKSGTPNDVLEQPFQMLHVAVCKLQAKIPTRESLQSTSIDLSVWTDIRQHAPLGKSGFVGNVALDPKLDLAPLKASLLLEKMHHLGEVFHCQPSAEELDTCTTVEELKFGIATDCSEAVVRSGLMIQGVVEINLQPLSEVVEAVPSPTAPSASPITAVSKTPATVPVAPKAEPNAPDTDGLSATQPAATSSAAKAKPTETLRVDIDRLDQLMSLAGQLVINKARFLQIGSQLKELSSFKSSLHCVSAANNTAERIAAALHESADSSQSLDTDSLRSLTVKLCNDLQQLQKELSEITKVRGAVNELNEAVHQLGRVSDGIQTTVMDTRMVPIGPLFTRFKRVVRDLSRDNHKQIELKICGENTELDKRMIDELGDPLIHLIRNSADHGIESPEERVAAGKPALGTITLNAFHRGNRIVIQIADDGRGLNADRIRTKALSKGLITEAEAERMSSHQIYQLIWKPGLSTAERITEVSGRGMGMDIVLSKIEQLNGSIDLTSEPGVGTRFEIKLPLTMAIVPSLLTVVDGEVFAIPVETIVEIVQLPPEAMPTVQGKLTARVRERIISVVALSDLFSWRGTRDQSSACHTAGTLVVVGHDGNELALAVDDLLGEQDVVIKSLEENFQNVEGIAGASILGDGRVSLILDVSALLSMAQQVRNYVGDYTQTPELMITGAN